MKFPMQCWDYGANLAYIKELIDYWRSHFDWRVQEQIINGFTHFRAWSDCNGDVESRFTKDELLTNLTIYWVTQTINSSIRIYYEDQHNSPPFKRGDRSEVPTAVALFPKDITHPPRELAERFFNVQRWTEMPQGGHFAAMEEPDLLVEDIRGFFRTLKLNSNC